MSSMQTDSPSLCQPSLPEAKFAALLTQLWNVATRSLRAESETRSEPGNVGNNKVSSVL